MSFVTTARFTVSPSARHSAAVSAVLPLPTGPPMPIRTARPIGAWWWCGSWPASVGSKLTGGSGSADKETPLFSVVPVVGLGQQVEARRAGRGEVPRVVVGRFRRGGGDFAHPVAQP